MACMLAFMQEAQEYLGRHPPVEWQVIKNSVNLTANSGVFYIYKI